MLPRYLHGHIVIFLKYRAPRVGDVILLQHRGREMIKRVGAVKGNDMLVFGDNSAASTDSREFGAVDAGQIRAIAVCSF